MKADFTGEQRIKPINGMEEDFDLQERTIRRGK